MLTTSKNILLSELSLSQDENKETLDDKIEFIVKSSYDKWMESNLS